MCIMGPMIITTMVGCHLIAKRKKTLIIICDSEMDEDNDQIEPNEKRSLNSKRMKQKHDAEKVV